MQDSVYFLFRGRNLHVYHVGGNRWVVVREHAEQASTTVTMEKAAAVEWARGKAQREGVDLVVHTMTGEVESREEFA